jgi:hypothetical protein
LVENSSCAGQKRKSLLRYSPAFVLLAILIADSNRHTDPDLWGHIRFGQEFIAGRHLIAADPYSYSAPNAPWHDYEWLAEVVMAWVYNLGGVLGLKLWKFTCTALIVGFLVETEAETGASFSIQLAVLLLSALGLVLQMQFRPQMFTFVLFAGLVALLTRENYRRGASLWIVVPLMALWANLHGGWVIGIATLVVYTVCVAARDLVEKTGNMRGLRLAALTLVSLSATLLNPYGVNLWRAVAWAVLAPYKRAVNVEWHPMLFAMAEQWHHGHSGIFIYSAILILIMGLVVSFLLAPKTGDIAIVGIASMTIVGALLSVRNMGLVAIAASEPLARRLEILARRYRAFSQVRSTNAVNQVVMLGLCAFLAFKTGLFATSLTSDQRYPSNALAFMKKHNLTGNILNEWSWGDYIIWHSAPASNVFIDGRDDTVYPIHIVRRYLRFNFDLDSGTSILDTYPHDFVLISTGSQARHLMKTRRDWKLIYRDSDSLLYARANSSAADIPNGPMVGPSSSAEGFP